MKTEAINIERSTNMSYLNRITKSNPDLIMEMITIYLEQTPILISGMKKAMQDQDWDSLHAVAHRMIPSFLIIGISSEYELMTKKIQKYSGSSEDSIEIEMMVEKVITVCENACKELEEEYNTLKTPTHE